MLTGGASQLTGLADSDVTLWRFPSGNTDGYTLAVTPPAGSPYLPTTVGGVKVVGDTNRTVTLATPVVVRGRLTNASGQPPSFRFET